MATPPDSPWLVAICSVLFDLDVGQRIDSIVPEGALTEEEANDVAFHSFPDSMSMELHSKSSVRDSTFFFRIKRRSVPLLPDGRPPLRLHHAPADASATVSSHYTECKSPYIYGFVFCRQRQDERLRRGGEQKSVVVLSMYPYSAVLGRLCQYAGPLFFNHGHDALVETFEDVLDWQEPETGGRATLAVGELSIMTHLPLASALPPPAPPEEFDLLGQARLAAASGSGPDDFSGTGNNGGGGGHGHGGPAEALHGTFFEVDIFTPLKSILAKAWVLWELALLAEPLMICAPTPGEASAAVAALISMVSPLPYSADFRPYFTIHDEDFGALAGGQLPGNSNALPRLLGVTNLYFLKALPGWPHVMSTGRRQTLGRSDSGSSGGGGSGGGGSSGSAASPSGGNGSGRLGAAMRAARRRAAGAQALLTDHVENVWLTGYRPLTRPATGLLARLLPSRPEDGPEKAARAAEANSAVLRRHFGELTTAFLAPFGPLFQLALPPEGEGPLPADGPPHPPPFSQADFVESLQTAKFPPPLLERFGSAANCIAFYRRFFSSPNFASWFERRRQAAWACQEELWAAAAAERGVEGDDSNPHQGEVDLVGTFFELEQRLQSASAAAAAPPPDLAPPQAAEALAGVRRDLVAVFEAMPRDLQQTMLSAPRRAELLHGLRAHTKVPIPGAAVLARQSHSDSPSALEAAVAAGQQFRRSSVGSPSPTSAGEQVRRSSSGVPSPAAVGQQFRRSSFGTPSPAAAGRQFRRSSLGEPDPAAAVQ